MSNENTLMKKAACMLIVNQEGKVLAVRNKAPSGRENPGWGLPGGVLQSRTESPEGAAIRKCGDETHYVAQGANLVDVRITEGVMCWVFMPLVVQLPQKKELAERAAWVEPSALLVGRFGEVNKVIFERLGLLEAP